jgi:hypothetical protein
MQSKKNLHKLKNAYLCSLKKLKMNLKFNISEVMMSTLIGWGLYYYYYPMTNVRE